VEALLELLLPLQAVQFLAQRLVARPQAIRLPQTVTQPFVGVENGEVCLYSVVIGSTACLF